MNVILAFLELGKEMILLEYKKIITEHSQFERYNPV